MLQAPSTQHLAPTSTAGTAAHHAGAGVGVGAGAGADAGAGAGAGSFFYCIARVISLSHFPGFVFV